MLYVRLIDVAITLPVRLRPKRITLYRPGPAFADGSHSFFLYMEHSTFASRDNSIVYINTENNEVDRSKVTVYTGTEWVPFPPTGLGSVFIARPVVVDMAGVTDGYIFYYWKDSVTGELSDVESTYFPSITPPRT